ncbi:hypothetical protein MMA231_00952 [Asticcacaulis sp. MM231]|uniref:hypothetical protein n=1 Tax=Asticcacaulis sp. MM231 TaxID=3157666 RepID=UPI0032D57E92
MTREDFEKGLATRLAKFEGQSLSEAVVAPFHAELAAAIDEAEQAGLSMPLSAKGGKAYFRPLA